jgi:hypothetical protein
MDRAGIEIENYIEHIGKVGASYAKDGTFLSLLYELYESQNLEKSCQDHNIQESIREGRAMGAFMLGYFLQSSDTTASERFIQEAK